MSFFADFLPALERAHRATRLIIPTTGCQLGASLLALEMGRGGDSAAYIMGRYSQAPERDHWWVELGALLLDPTRDQFGEDPFDECYKGRYVRGDGKLASHMEYEATMHLRLQWSFNRHARDAIKYVAAQYGLDQCEVEEPIGILTLVQR